ncbi:hypothetical protein NYR55_11395 [Sphingomonas sp. BGYR3]|uniref:hypothetical protein n=1 Tax=Sphingomonas sp. BGYR3 TaxID=2975483 RepID=UPI0021A49BE4|nr:hypothetical protein [Sphingomonas sp. BGYR3]MDG5489218.1 hypothetical protein [Sphingomonas sp. BGYR3]
MTTRTTHDIRDDLARNAHALAAAREDVALYDRLNAAKATVTRLAKEGEQLTAELSKALDEEAKASVAAFEKANQNFKIERIQHDQRAGLAHDRFIISWESLRYDMNARENVWQPQSADGFETLPDTVLGHLLQHKPSLIPADILSLMPGDPFAAMSSYLSGKRRGYFR